MTTSKKLDSNLKEFLSDISLVNILDNLKEGIIYTDEEGNITYLNRAAAELIEREKEIVLGDKIYDILNLHGKYNQVYVKRDNKILEVYSIPVYGLENGVKGTLYLLRDMTPEIELIEELYYLSKKLEYVVDRIKNSITPIFLICSDENKWEYIKNEKIFERLICRNLHEMTNVLKEIDRLWEKTENRLNKKKKTVPLIDFLEI